LRLNNLPRAKQNVKEKKEKKKKKEKGGKKERKMLKYC